MTAQTNPSGPSVPDEVLDELAAGLIPTLEALADRHPEARHPAGGRHGWVEPPTTRPRQRPRLRCDLCTEPLTDHSLRGDCPA